MKKTICAFLIIQALFFSVNAFSQADIYLKLTSAGYTFNGGTTATGYQNSLEVFSFSDGLAGCLTTGTNKTCAVSPSDFNFMTKLSYATTDLRSVLLQGKIISSADLYWVKSNGSGSTYQAYTIHMEDIKVTSLQESASSGGDDLPIVSVSLAPARIAWKTVSQNSAGGFNPPSIFGWDFAKNVPFTFFTP